MRCRSPLENSQPFSPILVFQPCGSFSMNSRQFAKSAALITSSSLAPLRPMRMFSITVLLNNVTYWKTIEKSDRRVSGSTFEISMPPIVTVPCDASQKRTTNRETVILPPPEGPMSAVACPCSAAKLTSSSTRVPSL